jgi:cell wall-associated NlpC family hydrolase
MCNAVPEGHDSGNTLHTAGRRFCDESAQAGYDRSRSPVLALRRFSWLVVLALAACGGGSAPEGTTTPAEASESSPPVEPSEPDAGLPTCAAPLDAPTTLPRVREEEQTLAYWLARMPDAELDRPLMSATDIADHDRAVGAGGEDLPFARLSLAAPPARELVVREVTERLDYIRERLADGRYVDGRAQRAPAEVLAHFEVGTIGPIEGALRVALERIPLRCGRDLAPFYTAPEGGAPIDTGFDRNACSTIEAQEPVQVLVTEATGLLVRTRYALGWIAADAPLSPALAHAEVTSVVSNERVRPARATTLTDEAGESLEVAADVLVPRDGSDATRVLFATATGLHRSAPLAPGAVIPTRRPLTRRAFLEEAFRHYGEPYGWGGGEGGLDCSELVMDVLATFDLDMPRHSARQAEVGTFSIPITPDMSERERLALADRALDHGVVLFHFPGHVMIYLGRTTEGEPRILHAFAEYLEPCATPEGGAGDQLRRVGRVSVSDMELGRGTSRRAFIERLDRIVVFGRPPEPDLQDVAQMRAAMPIAFPRRAERCTENVHARIFSSPAHPVAGQTLRFIVVTDDDPGLAAIEVIDRHGNRTRPEMHRLGGPPYTRWVEIPHASWGRYQVALGDGDRIVACDFAGVLRFPPEPPDPANLPEPPFPAVWEPHISWEADTEAFFAAFVEQLFRFPEGDDRTWNGLSELLRDPEHNLLYDHLGLHEDSAMDPDEPEEPLLLLRPDCADLPYFLRAYFAWKLRLPFGYRRCSRGRAGIPPTCEEIAGTSSVPHEYRSEVAAFEWFANHMLAPSVHSATARTAPDDENTDLYPVRLERRALAPGTVFADPYGHLIVVAQWIPERPGHWGSLIGADAQPDGTIGRRTFWRGTFLFTSDTRDVGAGFKAWRPIVYDDETMTYTELPNEELDRRSGHLVWSREQYAGSTDDWYDRMEALIDPRPLDANDRMVALVDALEESVVRRVVSIDVGEQYFREHAGTVVPMPDGVDIFQTEGAWEDFSTPSRDMRLLVAIDTVMGFPEAVRRRPERYGIAPGDVERVVESVTARRDQELGARRFSYTRSDGTAQELALSEVVRRSTAFEVSWNPNDCPEVRWGAPSGTDEARTCARHAPADQQQRMEQTMRAWFHARARPVR